MNKTDKLDAPGTLASCLISSSSMAVSASSNSPSSITSSTISPAVSSVTIDSLIGRCR
jgi:hypothetical protein